MNRSSEELASELSSILENLTAKMVDGCMVADEVATRMRDEAVDFAAAKALPHLAVKAPKQCLVLLDRLNRIGIAELAFVSSRLVSIAQENIPTLPEMITVPGLGKVPLEHDMYVVSKRRGIRQIQITVDKDAIPLASKVWRNLREYEEQAIQAIAAELLTIYNDEYRAQVNVETGEQLAALSRRDFLKCCRLEGLWIDTDGASMFFDDSHLFQHFHDSFIKVYFEDGVIAAPRAEVEDC